MKTSLKVIIVSLALIFISFSCKKEGKPKAVVRVVEMSDSVLVPVYKAFVEIGPATQEEVLDDVVSSGYTNSSGYVEFEFDKELVLRAVAHKYKRDETGQLVLDGNGDPITIKSGYKTLILKTDYTDNKTIEVK